jgi:hypothetical protein
LRTKAATRAHRSNHFDHRNSTDQITHRVAMRILGLLRVDTIPNFALKKPAGYQLLFLELKRRAPIFGQQMCKRH